MTSRAYIGLLVLAAIVAAATAFALLAVAGAAPAGTAQVATGKGASIRAPGFLLDNGRYTTIQAPGARTHTYAHGINNRGQIAGGFDNPSTDGPGGNIHGSVREKSGQFFRFDIPGAMATVAHKINDRGDIVGGSLDTGAGAGLPGSNGFLLRRGKFTTLRVPGSLSTQALGLNRGQVVGEYIDPSGAFRGFLWEEGRFTTVVPTGSLGGTVTDINDRGQMVGASIDMDGTIRGFLLSKGVYTTIAAPYGPRTIPYDINNRGQIVGTTFADAVGTENHGFLLAKGVMGPFTPIDFPGGLGTIARGIDDRGRIVGLYDSPGTTPRNTVGDPQSVPTHVMTVFNRP